AATLVTRRLVDYAMGGLAVGGDSVYFANYDAPSGGLDGVAACAVTGCNDSPRVLPAPPPGSMADGSQPRVPAGVAVRGPSAFWASMESNEIVATPTGPADSPGGAFASVLAVVTAPTAIAADADSVYFGGFETGTIYRCPLGGCGGAPTVVGTAPG